MIKILRKRSFICFHSDQISKKNSCTCLLLPKKEIIFIVTKTEQKNAIMQAIMKNAGADSKAKAITFSLPVSATAGLRLLED